MSAYNNVEHHKRLCNELNDIYEAKNHDYGDSFHETFLEDGLAMSRIRLSDKLSRFKKLSHLNPGESAQVQDESIRDTLMDLANYAIMTVQEMEREKKITKDEIVGWKDNLSEMTMTVEKATRLCKVGDKFGYFHDWEHYSQPVAASMFIGGEPAGVLSRVYGIVEFENGTRRVDPIDILFCDEEHSLLAHMNEMQKEQLKDGMTSKTTK